MCFYDVLSVNGPEKWQAEKQFFEMTGKVFPDALDVIRLWDFFFVWCPKSKCLLF